MHAQYNRGLAKIRVAAGLYHLFHQELNILWCYHKLGMQVSATEAAVALGSYDLRVASRAAELWHAGLVRYVICSGASVHSDGLLKTSWQRTEAEEFAAVLNSDGVPEANIFIEPLATNTAENIEFSSSLLMKNRMDFSSIIFVTKPNMERRVFATARRAASLASFYVTSQKVGFVEYLTDEITAERLANLMVGDLQRLIVYARLGFSEQQQIPLDVLDAADRLVSAGYTAHLIEPWEI